jgi:ubiquinone/menaquinone biosynthesis C-methylase UbiE
MKNKTQLEKYLNPENVVQQTDLKEGETAADLGCGKGYFIIPLAKKVGEKGKVYAIDVLEEALDTARSTAEINSLDNIVFQRANLEEKNSVQKFIQRGSVDLAIISNVLFANQEKENIILEAVGILKSGKELIIIDWNRSGFPIAPSPELLVDPNKVMEFCSGIGLVFKKDLEVGKYYWGKVFIKQ